MPVDNSIQALAEAYQRFIEKNLSEEKTLYIIVGTDAAFFPNLLLQYNLPDGSRYLFIEPDNEFEHANSHLIEHDSNKVFISKRSDWRKKYPLY